MNGSGYATVADASQTGLDMGLSDFMVELRVKLAVPAASQSSAQPAFVDKADGADSGWSIYFDSSQLLTVLIYDTTKTAFVDYPSTPLDDLYWHTVIGIVDRSSATGIKLYIDGVELEETRFRDPSTLGSIDSTSAFVVGDVEGDSQLCNARFDELRVWNFGVDGLPSDYADYVAWRSTNPFVATSEYDSNSWATYITNNLSAYYKFDGDYTDESSNSNDLTAGGSGNTFPVVWRDTSPDTATYSDVSPDTTAYKRGLLGQLYAGFTGHLYSGSLTIPVNSVETDFYSGYIGTAAGVTWTDEAPDATVFTDVTLPEDAFAEVAVGATSYTDVTLPSPSYTDVSPGTTTFTDVSPSATTWTDVSTSTSWSDVSPDATSWTDV